MNNYHRVLILWLAIVLALGQTNASFGIFSKIKNSVSGSSNSTQNEKDSPSHGSNNETQQYSNWKREDNNGGFSHERDPSIVGHRNNNQGYRDPYEENGHQQQQQFSYLGVDGDSRIPFWNIAHMINSIDQIQPMLSNGSNGIEVDVSFDKRGIPVESYHGFPCDCGRHCHFREDFVKLIKYIASISVPPASSNLQLVLFDLKLSDLDEKQKLVAGESLASILHEHLYDKYASASKLYQPQYRNLDKPPLRVIISINYVHDVVLIKSFLRYLQKNRLESMRKLVGFDVGMNDKLANISNMWFELENHPHDKTTNIWQGDGLTNCANLVRGTDRLREAVSIRNDQGYFRKIYYWTVDVLYQTRSILRLGVDAVLTNQPQRIIQVLEEDEFKYKYRLATPFDDPFAQYWIKPSAKKMSLPTAMEAKETIDNIKNTSINFIKTLPDGISAAVKKVLSPKPN